MRTSDSSDLLVIAIHSHSELDIELRESVAIVSCEDDVDLVVDI